jgi:AcrR family transcriptional regulator
MTRGSIYNHFEGKDEIFGAALERYHPWLHIPPSVKAAEGDSIEELVKDAAERMLVAWGKQPEMIRLHLIELIEFQGRHLPKLFDDTFEKMTAVVREMVAEREDLASVPIATLSRSLLGLFFAYLMTDRFTGVPVKTGFDQDMFEYFADAYLHGLLSKEINNP